ncbi:hypothetical protein HOY80DRAFT_1033269 [Tuber brumale]|nr:hypothetical protein HOY80DRAFT_1033269 [Tuber brumale]
MVNLVVLTSSGSKKGMENTKKRIKCPQLDNRVIQYYESLSRTPLVDSEAKEYLEFEISGDEESKKGPNQND